MAVMTISQVKEARQACYDRLQEKGYDPQLQITSKAQLIEVIKDVFEGIPAEQPGVIGLHVYDKTGGMFISLLERVADDALRMEVIKEVNQNDTSRKGSSNRYPGKITAGDVSLLVLRSGCTTADISELGRTETSKTKFNDPAGMPDFMKTPAARGIFVGSAHLQA